MLWSISCQLTAGPTTLIKQGAHTRATLRGELTCSGAMCRRLGRPLQVVSGARRVLRRAVHSPPQLRLPAPQERARRVLQFRIMSASSDKRHIPG